MALTLSREEVAMTTHQNSGHSDSSPSSPPTPRALLARHAVRCGFEQDLDKLKLMIQGGGAERLCKEIESVIAQAETAAALKERIRCFRVVHDFARQASASERETLFAVATAISQPQDRKS
jgi:hypothetical protein